ncbi:lytic transglycosylase domain-containing protein [Herbiconiux sp. KACC 21604]|uniref:aggregation-promoting factor C-terminal-like domain-containing protein n=1 Tax=unclassified Herbiconiux TaxID=2618217 RepID=UPI001C0F8A6D|nr:lytic transglycosylase domain-containing protein [Herbiconiux sp. KACC 21604]
MAKHSLTEARPKPAPRARGAVRRTPNRGRVALQVIGLAAVTACAFVTVVAPNLQVQPAVASFDGTFAQGDVEVQNLDVSGSVAASVFRDGYSVTEAPKPVIVEVAVPKGSSSSSSSDDDGCPDPNAAVADPAGAQAVAAELAAARGWTGAQFDALLALWSRESGWRVNALNKSSCAYGIPQALPGSKMSAAGADWLTNPATQITWGLNYIQGRYGDPLSALAHSDANHWY